MVYHFQNTKKDLLCIKARLVQIYKLKSMIHDYNQFLSTQVLGPSICKIDYEGKKGVSNFAIGI